MKKKFILERQFENFLKYAVENDLVNYIVFVLFVASDRGGESAAC